MTGRLFLTADQTDGALLLIACGATTRSVADHLGVSGATLGRHLTKHCPDAYRAAVAARPFLRRDHGTKARYRRGCRCWDCTEANTAAGRELRNRKKPPTHGTGSAYRNHGCRCDECRAAGAVLNRDLQRKIKNGECDVAHGTWPRIALGCACRICRLERDRVLASLAAANSESRDAATRHGYQWTGPEYETIARDDLTTLQMASMLGRTIHAVRAQRRLLLTKKNPRHVMVAGL